MAQIDLTKYGIKGTTEVVYNPSYEQLFKDELDPNLEGYEKGQLTELGAVNVMTGIYTGRSPKDKFIVIEADGDDYTLVDNRDMIFVYDGKEKKTESYGEDVITHIAKHFMSKIVGKEYDY